MINKKLLITYIVLIIIIKTFALQIEKVSNNTYATFGKTGLPSKENGGFISNTYGVLTNEGWVVIDSLSSPTLAKQFIKQLKSIKNVPVKYLIITHYHLDHSFGMSAYKGAKIIAHKNLKRDIQNSNIEIYKEMLNKTFDNLFKNVKFLNIDIPIDKKISIKVGNLTFEIFPLPNAHTHTDILIYIPQTKELFAGDIIFYNRIPFIGDNHSNSKNWLKILKQIEKMKISKIYNGHNKPLDKKAIKFTYEYIYFLRSEISRLKDEDLFYDEIKEKLSSTEWKKYPMFKEFHNKNIYKIFNDLDFEF
ncbi:MAG TPA: MBL fold metallo-hydrolase [Persephonella sp.]|nr:MBL fold metallo-hydrolase [Hydrogenothermaceae bacterium]HIQ24536.1 MBL fold metallo-hydrolase [Persephonella sp.]